MTTSFPRSLVRWSGCAAGYSNLLGFRVSGPGCRVSGLGFRVSGVRAEGLSGRQLTVPGA